VSAGVLGLLALLLVAGAAVAWFRLALAVRLPENRTGFVAAWAGGALLGLVALLQGPGWAGGIPAGLALFAGALLVGLVAISPQQAADDAIRVGEKLRDFSAPDDSGARFALASSAGRPLLLKFFRGHW
jgi:hypothetical protein